jgi:hypothetical protein
LIKKLKENHYKFKRVFGVMSNSSSFINGMNDAEIASEKYLGQNYLRDLNAIVPKINSETLAFLINDSNDLLETCNAKYSFDILNSKDDFDKKINVLFQIIEIDSDQAKINDLSQKVQQAIVELEAQVKELNKSLEPLSEIYLNEEYINNIIPDELEQSRLIPRIVGVVQIATLKRETIYKMIKQARDVEYDLINFSDTTMFQIREGLSRVSNTDKVFNEVTSEVSFRLNESVNKLKLLSFNNFICIAFLAIAFIFGVIGFPLPSDTVGTSITFTFTIFIFSLGLLSTALYLFFSKNQILDIDVKKQYVNYIKFYSLIGVISLILSSFLISINNQNFDFYQFFPLITISIFVLGVSSFIGGSFFSNKLNKTKNKMLSYQTRLNNKKTAD